ncbi:MAG: autotransporter domain-containing protein [Proteobacteria bacterium]|nr:autotransporter domain-containing protein [Pseudomonadota bacterium]
MDYDIDDPALVTGETMPITATIAKDNDNVTLPFTFSSDPTVTGSLLVAPVVNLAAISANGTRFLPTPYSVDPVADNATMTVAPPTTVSLRLINEGERQHGIFTEGEVASETRNSAFDDTQLHYELVIDPPLDGEAESLAVDIRVQHSGRTIFAVDQNPNQARLRFNNNSADSANSRHIEIATPAGDSTHSVTLRGDIPSGQASPGGGHAGRFTMHAFDRTVEETTTINVTILASERYRVGADNSIRLRIIDDDPPFVITSNVSQVAAGGSINFTVTAENTPSTVVASQREVRLVFSDGDGGDANDLVVGSLPASVTLPRNSNSTSFVVDIAEGASDGTLLADIEVIAKGEANRHLTPYRLGAGYSTQRVTIGTPIEVQVATDNDNGDTHIYEHEAARFIISGTGASSQALPPKTPFAYGISYERLNGGSGGVGAALVPTLMPSNAGTITYDPASERGTITLARGGLNEVAVVIEGYDDASDNAPRNLTLTLRQAPEGGYTLAGSGGESASLVVVDDDPALRLTANMSRVIQGNSVNITVATMGDTPVEVNNVVRLAYTDADDLIPSGEEASEVTILAGDSNANLTLRIRDNSLTGGNDGTFGVRILQETDAALDNRTPYRLDTSQDGLDEEEITVWDGVLPTLNLAEDAVSVVEGNNTGSPNMLRFEVTLSETIATQTSFTYTITAGTAQAEDYGIPQTGTGSGFANRVVQIPANQQSVTISVPITGDRIDEDDQTLTLTLTAVGDGSVGLLVLGSDVTATGTIIDDDDAPTLAVVGKTASETVGTADIFDIEVTGETEKSIQYQFALTDVTATVGEDYIAPTTTTLAFAPGQPIQHVRLSVRDDDIIEPDQTFTVRLTSAENATITTDGRATATSTITSDDTGEISLVAGAAGNESGTPATFTFTITETGSATPATHQFPDIEVVGTLGVDTAGDNPATLATDLAAGVGTTFTANIGTSNTTASDPFPIAINDDDLDEANVETLTAMLTSISPTSIGDNLTINTSPIILNVEDNDAPPSVSVEGPASPVTEGNTATFTIRLSEASGRPVSVTYETDGGNATAGTDYTEVPSTTRIIPAGMTIHEVQVATTADTNSEGEEAFDLMITAAENATIDTATATATLADVDNPQVTITPTAASITEGDTQTFTIAASPRPTGGESVTLNVAVGITGDTATLTDDYTVTGDVGSITLTAADSYTHDVVIATTDNDGDEPNESLTIQISNVAGGGGLAVLGSDNSASVTIVDNDNPSYTITYDPSTLRVNEGSDLTVTATLDADWHTDYTDDLIITITPDVSAGTAEAADLTTTNAQTITISAGSDTGTTTIATATDTLYEGDETFSISISDNHADATTTSPASETVTIVDDEGVPNVSIGGDVDMDEGNSGTTAFTFPLTLSGAVEEAVTVTYTLAHGTTNATDAADFAGSTTIGQPQTATIPSGETTANIVVNVNGDGVVEDNETFTLTLNSVTSATGGVTLAGDTTAIGTIINDDMHVVPVASVQTPTPATEGQPTEFRITLTQATTRPVSVDYTITDISTTAGDDYSLADASGTITIPAGDDDYNVTIATIDDGSDEDPETYTFALASAVNATIDANNAEAVATINDNDEVPTLSIMPLSRNVSVYEGDSANVSIQVSIPSGKPITVQYRLSGGDISSSFTSPSTATGTLTIPAGMATATINLTATDDNIASGDSGREFNLNLASPANATLDTTTAGATTALVTIYENDFTNMMRISGETEVPVGTNPDFNLQVDSRLAGRDLAVNVHISDDQNRTANRVIIIPAGASDVSFEVGYVDTTQTGNITVRIMPGEGYSIDPVQSVFTTAIVPAVIFPTQNGTNATLADTTGDQANRAILPELAAYLSRQMTATLSSRIFAVLRGDSDTTSSRSVTLDGQTLEGYARSHARREEAENPWDRPSASRTNLMPEIYDLAFNLPVQLPVHSRGGSGSGHGLTLWGEGVYSESSATATDTANVGGVAFDGTHSGGVVGADVWVSDRMLAGVAFATTEAEFDFTLGGLAGTAGRKGSHTTELTGTYPYLGFITETGASLWGAAGFGEGDVEVTSNGTRLTSTLSTNLFALGFERPLDVVGSVDAAMGLVKLSLVGEASYAEVELDAGRVVNGSRLAAAEAGSEFVRLGLHLSQTKDLTGLRVTTEADMAVRYDEGDVFTGGGVEFGLGIDLAWANGLAVDVSGRGLLLHNDDAEDWGVRGGIRWASGAGGRGFGLSLTPEWGNTASRHDDLFGSDMAEFSTAADAGEAGGRYRLDLGYGIDLSGTGLGDGLFGGDVLLTPFVRRQASEDSGQVNLGADFRLGAGFRAGYEAVMPDAEDASASDRVYLDYQRKF